MQELLPKLSVVNVVATADLNQSVDLNKVGLFSWGSYSPSKYRGRVAYIKNLPMKGKVSVFLNGKLISVGTKSEAEARGDISTACKLLEEVGLIKRTTPIAKIRNVVALAKLPMAIDLEAIARKMSHIIYEPEQFPAAILRSDKYPEVTALVFSSGKLVIAGAKSASSLKSIVQYLSQLLTETCSKDGPDYPPGGIGLTPMSDVLQ